MYELSSDELSLSPELSLLDSSCPDGAGGVVRFADCATASGDLLLSSLPASSAFIMSSRSNCCPFDEDNEGTAGIIFTSLFCGIIFAENLLDEELVLCELLSLLSLSSMSEGIQLISFFAEQSLCLLTDLSFAGVS